MLRLYWREHDSVVVEIVEIILNRRVSMLWPINDVRPPTRVDIDLIPHKGGTQLTVEDSGYGDEAHDPALIHSISRGWGAYLICLKARVELGVDLRDAEL